MKAIKILPGHEPELIDIENTFMAFQDVLGSRIEVVIIPRTGLSVMVEEESKLFNLPNNGVLNIGPLTGRLLAGTVLVVRCSRSGGGFSDIRDCDLGLIRACWVSAKGAMVSDAE